MNLEKRISSFSALGQKFRSFEEVPADYMDAMKVAEKENPWFTFENIKQAFLYWGLVLDCETIGRWLKPYHSNIQKITWSRRVGVIMAGNIPLVGFHDLLCVLLSGHNLLAKLSSQDASLIPVIVRSLTEIEPAWENRIKLTSGEVKRPDAIIATGSNNTSRYFSYYFGKYPHVIRKNRTGVAILDGSETIADLNGIACDIFSYFGLGCRNVSKLYLPENYNLKHLHNAFLQYKDLFHHSKYRNNLDYYKSIFLVNRTPFLDGVFYLLREDEALSTPVSVIHYEYYKDLVQLKRKLDQQQDQIQCVVARKGLLSGSVTEPGKTQLPALNDYADGIDTMRFLTEKI